MDNLIGLIGDPSKVRTPSALSWLQRSKAAALVWNAMRIWLGVMWLQAGIAKIWGAENSAFLHHNGAGVAGFATHAVAAYSWWGSFLHSFVVPLACLASLLLLFTYVMSGTASVCAFYALFAIVILAMWRTSSWIGVDGFISGYRQRHASARLIREDEAPTEVSVELDSPEPARV